MFEFRAFVFKYAHHNPNGYEAIQSVWDILQSERASSTSASQRVPDATPSTPTTHASPNILDYSGPNQSVDRQGNYRKRSTGKRTITRGRPSSIIVPDTVTPLSSVGAEEDARAHRISKHQKVKAMQRSSSMAIDRNPSTCPAAHVSTENTSRSPTGHRGKRRKLTSDGVPVPQEQEELHTAPATKASDTSECVQPHRSDEKASELSNIPSDLLAKLSLIGSAEVLRDLKHTLFLSRSHPCQVSLVPHRRIEALPTSASNDTLRSLQTAQILSMLRNELEVTQIGEQMCRFRKRLALSQFFDVYEFAQKNPSSVLQEDSKTRQGTSDYTTSKQAPRQSSQVLNRVTDLMFPYTAFRSEVTIPAGPTSRQMHEKLQRAAAVKKIQDWRWSGKHWSAIVKRFGQGILLLLPKSMPDEM